ncbi:MAG: hypothetical protein GY928_01055 [Colwellia sp.]|nr:hypothetical protein [Colwellia sp.]
MNNAYPDYREDERRREQHGERIATLEANVIDIRRSLKKMDDSISGSVNGLTVVVGSLDKKIAGWKGVTIGVTFIVSLIWTVFYAFKDQIMP